MIIPYLILLKFVMKTGYKNHWAPVSMGRAITELAAKC